MSKKMTYFSVLGFLIVLGVLMWNVTARAAYESAPYQVIETDGTIEVREYPDLVLVSTESNFEARGNDGSFMRLFGYISGQNESKQKIEMTTPVFMEQGSSGASGKMGFVLPGSIAEAGAPAPKRADITILKRPGGRFAVIRFSGVMSSEKAKAQETKLREWLKSHSLEGETAAERAGYDPPFTPGPLRRNEVLIRLKSQPTGTPTPPPAAK